MVAAPANKNLKYLSLVILILLTVALVLTLRYSRTMKTEGPRYLSSTAVLVAEGLKFITCVFVIFGEHRWRFGGFRTAVEAEVVQKSRETLKVGVPALLYVIQSNLLFLALSNLDAATYQVTYQLKILTTAMFSVTMLGRRLNRLKWVSLVLLVIGIALVQMPADSKEKGKGQKDSDVHSYSGQVIGLGAVLAACFSSGFSGVYMERILKGTPTSLWMRNLQLAFFSIFGSGFMILLYDYGKVKEDGFFQGYNWIIWIVVLLQKKPFKELESDDKFDFLYNSSQQTQRDVLQNSIRLYGVKKNDAKGVNPTEILRRVCEEGLKLSNADTEIITNSGLRFIQRVESGKCIVFQLNRVDMIRKLFENIANLRDFENPYNKRAKIVLTRNLCPEDNRIRSECLSVKELLRERGFRDIKIRFNKLISVNGGQWHDYGWYLEHCYADAERREQAAANRQGPSTERTGDKTPRESYATVARKRKPTDNEDSNRDGDVSSNVSPTGSDTQAAEATASSAKPKKQRKKVKK